MDAPRPAFPYRGHCSGVHSQAAPALEAEDLSVAYPGSGPAPVGHGLGTGADAGPGGGFSRGARAALHGVTLRVETGQRVALVGPNGAGKSTLLRAAAGLLPPASGSIRLFGHRPGVCQHQVAYLPQSSDLDWAFPIDVRRLVLTGRYVHLGWFRRPSREDHQRVDDALRLLGLEGVAGRQIDRLSGGQQQRTLLARALVHGADLLLLDEPLNAVDAETRHVVDAVLDRLRSEGVTVVMATHDIGRLEEAYFDRAFYFNEGRPAEPE